MDISQENRSNNIRNICIYSISHQLAAFYGVALAALGTLSTTSMGLTIDASGIRSISDNACCIAQMRQSGEATRIKRTDALDAAGNTIAAICTGFAIGSAAIVSSALFSDPIDMLHAFSFVVC